MDPAPTPESLQEEVGDHLVREMKDFYPECEIRTMGDEEEITATLSILNLTQGTDLLEWALQHQHLGTKMMNLVGLCHEHVHGLSPPGTADPAGIADPLSDDHQKTPYEWFRKSAELGDAYAMYRLSTRHEPLFILRMLGHETVTEDVATREKDSFRWASRSAETGYPLGLYTLARCYDLGVGVTKDVAKALALYSESGIPEALYELGVHQAEAGDHRTAFHSFHQAYGLLMGSPIISSRPIIRACREEMDKMASLLHEEDSDLRDVRASLRAVVKARASATASVTAPTPAPATAPATGPAPPM